MSNDEFAEFKTRAKKTIDELVAGFDYEVSGSETLEEIHRLVEERRQEEAAEGGPFRVSPQPATAAVNFLRHERTGYDWQHGQVQSAIEHLDFAMHEEGLLEDLEPDEENPLRDFFDELEHQAHERIRRGTLEAISERFPELADETARQRNSNYAKGGGVTTYVGHMRRW